MSGTREQPLEESLDDAADARVRADLRHWSHDLEPADLHCSH